MAIASEDKAELFVTQFTTNSTIEPQTKQPLTISKVESLFTEIAFKYRAFRYVLNRFKSKGGSWIFWVFTADQEVCPCGCASSIYAVFLLLR